MGSIKPVKCAIKIIQKSKIENKTRNARAFNRFFELPLLLTRLNKALPKLYMIRPKAMRINIFIIQKNRLSEYQLFQF